MKNTKLFSGALVVSLGWFTGMRIVKILDRAVWKTIYDTKMVQEYIQKKKQKSCKNSRK